MKIINTTILTAICVSGLLLSAAAQRAVLPGDNNAAATPDTTSPAATPDQPPPPPGAPDMGNNGGPDAGPPPMMGAQPEEAGTNEVEMASADETNADDTDTDAADEKPATATVILPKGSAPEAVASAFEVPAQTSGTNSNDLTLNFTRAPMDMVLTYLSDAAGFIVVQDTPASGNVTVKGQHLTKDEVVDLLNAELNRNGYAAIRNERTLTIVNKNDAKTRNIPVKTGNIWTNIPNDDEIATWIIPIRFIAASQLVSDLESFVSAEATIVANADGNSIIITDTQSNIRHLAQIIRMVDDSAEMETVVRVFPLRFASPVDVANELTSIFPGSNGSQSPVQFAGGRGGRGGGLFGGGGSGNTQQRIQKAQAINVVADTRISAVIVTAPNDLMNQIVDMMADLDVPSERDQDVYVFSLKNADPNQAVQVLQNMFSSTTARNNNNTTSPLIQRATSTASSMGTATPSTGIGTTGGGGGGGGGGGRTF
jgi:type II secretory pathway component GspD/PulD (secretin)